jgi:hypothetical protein
MNETPKENTPPLSMPSVVSGASELRCVEPIFSEQVNGAEIKLGLAATQVRCHDLSVTISSKRGSACDMTDGPPIGLQLYWQHRLTIDSRKVRDTMETFSRMLRENMIADPDNVCASLAKCQTFDDWYEVLQKATHKHDLAPPAIGFALAATAESKT